MSCLFQKNSFLISLTPEGRKAVRHAYLGNEGILTRYIANNPNTNKEMLHDILFYRPRHFFWAGTDILNTTDVHGHRKMIILETNSSPAGQSAMPLSESSGQFGGWGHLIRHTFKDLVSGLDRMVGGLAVLFDKTPLEASGYAAAMVEIMKEKVYLVKFDENDPNPAVKWVNKIMHVRDDAGAWHPIRACLRYVTQKPWNRFPIRSETLVLNSTLACLAGGRNKAMAAMAYDLYNIELEKEKAGIQIRTPETIVGVSKSEIPHLVKSMGGLAVIKVPYSNSGQGVYTITNPQELRSFMLTSHPYEKFIVQGLVGKASWTSVRRRGQLFHVGTTPDHENRSYAFDLRLVVAGSPFGHGFRPIAMTARRASKPLSANISDVADSWAMLGTSIAVKTQPDGNHSTAWKLETERFLPMDEESFNLLGLSMDDLIDAYIQTVLSVIAIDKMCGRLMPRIGIAVQSQIPQVIHPVMRENSAAHAKGTKAKIAKRMHCKFDSELFNTLARDRVLFNEIMM